MSGTTSGSNTGTSTGGDSSTGGDGGDIIHRGATAPKPQGGTTGQPAPADTVKPS